MSDTRVKAKHPVTGNWRIGTLLRSSGRKATIQFGDETPVDVASKDIRPVARKGKRGR